MERILSFNKKYRLGIVCALILALTVFTGTAVAFSDGGGSFDDTDAAFTTVTEISEGVTGTVPDLGTEVSYTFATKPAPPVMN